MQTILDPVAFEWDEGNSEKNYRKHQVTRQEAEEVFINEPFIISEDVTHSNENEKRFQGLGRTNYERKLFISFTIRNEKIRVISVRDMSKKEGVVYEKLKKNS